MHQQGVGQVRADVDRVGIIGLEDGNIRAADCDRRHGRIESGKIQFRINNR